jgi:hypothetical protein
MGTDMVIRKDLLIRPQPQVETLCSQLIPHAVTNLHKVLALKFVYYLDGKRATLISMLENISILPYEKARGG